MTVALSTVALSVLPAFASGDARARERAAPHASALHAACGLPARLSTKARGLAPALDERLQVDAPYITDVRRRVELVVEQRAL
eukprot:1975943-Pleurochrysis_carterae.AAC.1